MPIQTKIRKMARRAFKRCLSGYQLMISPFFPPACRFHPTCSEYMSQAVDKYGVRKGFMLGIKRLLKCHPFHAGGIDPVP